MFPKLSRWLISLEQDVLENFIMLIGHKPDGQSGGRGQKTADATLTPSMNDRYGVNLFVDNTGLSQRPIIVEPNPSLENLVGCMEYTAHGGQLETNFTLIRAGAMHRANGGILVLRAETLAGYPDSWRAIKQIIRDRTIRIEEPQRSNVALASSPSPKSIAVDVKIVIVGNPYWYYSFFSADKDFQLYFKIKADIDGTMPATKRNLELYGKLLQSRAKVLLGHHLDPSAIARLLGASARWAGSRNELTTRIELFDDILVEAKNYAPLVKGKSGHVKLEQIDKAFDQRLYRKNSIENKMISRVEDGTVLVDVKGVDIGQVNALTVRDMGDHQFGSVARVTARASVGRSGVTNIERDVALGGPIQQKGMMVLQGYLNGLFARSKPLSFNCSVTFEQSYGGVEGDSASLAELLAILSDLSGHPLRQDLAITGSVNQKGDAQAVGGVHHKIEGFYKACLALGDLTGTQGVVIPKSNHDAIVVNDDVKQAVTKGLFHIYVVSTLEQAIELFTGLKAGKRLKNGMFGQETFYGMVDQKLNAFNRAMVENNE